jgi:hypothetical protein
MNCARNTRPSVDKRLRPTGTDQYTFAEGKYRPLRSTIRYAPPPAETRRAGLSEDLDVLVIGAGFGGHPCLGPRCEGKGIDNFRIVDVAADFRRHLVLEPLSGAALRRRILHLPPLPRRDGSCPDRALRARHARSSPIASSSAAISASTTGRCSRRRSPACAGRLTGRARWRRYDIARRYVQAPASSPRRAASSAGRSCPAFRG